MGLFWEAVQAFAGKMGERSEATGEEKSLINHSTLIMSGNEVSLSAGGAGGTAGAYGDSWVAYSCIRRLAQDAGGIPLTFLSDPKDPESVLPGSHPTVSLFRNPNPYFSSGEFLQWLILILNLRGEFFISFDDPIRPTMMYQYSDPLHWREIVEGGVLLGWEYRHGATHITEADDSLVHHRFIDPARPFRGQAPLLAAAAAYRIDRGSENVQQSTLRRGGERTLMLSSQKGMTPVQRKQAATSLKGRRRNDGTVGQDIILPADLTPIDPKFLADDKTIMELQAMQPDKVCAVYGMSKSLLGFEDIDKYATFLGRQKVYFHQTLVPMLQGVESSFDRFFVENQTSRYRAFVRFDFTNVKAMQEDRREQMELAGLAHDKGIPWAAVEEMTRMGLPLGMIPAADRTMVNSSLAPLDKVVEEWDGSGPSRPVSRDGDGGGEPGDEPAGDGEKELRTGSPPLTQELVNKRARDVRGLLRRKRQLAKTEKELRVSWKKGLQVRMRKAERGLAGATTAKEVDAAVKGALKGWGTESADMAEKAHKESALVGEVSIVELVEGKLSDTDAGIYRKAHKWRPKVAAFFAKRRNLIKGMENVIYEDVRKACTAAVLDGAPSAEVQAIARARFGASPGGINRTLTIARTEVGTAYNIARFSEMDGQGFKSHFWITSGGPDVRDGSNGDYDHTECDGQSRRIGKEFSCGLLYPMQDGGDAGNVINCECDTVPEVGGS